MIAHPNSELNAVLRRLTAEAALAPAFVGLDALAVGGSLSRGLATVDSDLDLFGVVREDAPENTGGSVLSWTGADVIRGPISFPGLGSIFTGVLPGLAMVQIILRELSQIGAHPMEQWSIVVFDRSGHLQGAVARSAATALDPALIYQDNVRFFWHRTLQGWRALQSGQLWRAIGYLAEVQRGMLQQVRFESGRFDPSGSPLFPATRVERDLGADVSTEIGEATARYNHAEIASAYRFAAKWFAESSERTDARHGGPAVSPRFLQSVARLLGERL